MSGSTVVLYHANCADGFGAAWAASIVLGRGPDVVYIPVNYGQAPPAEIASGVSRLFILDFSYSRATMEQLAQQATEIVCLDHHKTAQAELNGLPYAVFDMDKSGAVLAWEHFHPAEPVPQLLLYIQDRDLWRWELPDSREFSAALALEPKDFARWSEIAKFIVDKDDDCWYFDHLVERGRAIFSVQSHHVASIASHAFMGSVGDHTVPCVNSPVFQSEIGEKLCLDHPESPFAAVFTVGESEEIWSLRSRNGFDVSAVARALGGGGHPAAAGFKKPRN